MSLPLCRRGPRCVRHADGQLALCVPGAVRLSLVGPACSGRPSGPVAWPRVHRTTFLGCGLRGSHAPNPSGGPGPPVGVMCEQLVQPELKPAGKRGVRGKSVGSPWESRPG